jgi:hypothetical protein
MKQKKNQTQTITVQCPKPVRLTTRQLHYQLFKYMKSGKSGCFVVTHLGVPRMISFLVTPEVGYLLLAKGAEVEVNMD